MDDEKLKMLNRLFENIVEVYGKDWNVPLFNKFMIERQNKISHIEQLIFHLESFDSEVAVGELVEMLSISLKIDEIIGFSVINLLKLFASLKNNEEFIKIQDFDVEITENHKENKRILSCSLQFLKDNNLLLKVKNSKTFHEFLTKIKTVFLRINVSEGNQSQKKEDLINN